jgi:hypothetical protein
MKNWFHIKLLNIEVPKVQQIWWFVTSTHSLFSFFGQLFQAVDLVYFKKIIRLISSISPEFATFTCVTKKKYNIYLKGVPSIILYFDLICYFLLCIYFVRFWRVLNYIIVISVLDNDLSKQLESNTFLAICFNGSAKKSSSFQQSIFLWTVGQNFRTKWYVKSKDFLSQYIAYIHWIVPVLDCNMVKIMVSYHLYFWQGEKGNGKRSRGGIWNDSF